LSEASDDDALLLADEPATTAVNEYDELRQSAIFSKEHRRVMRASNRKLVGMKTQLSQVVKSHNSMVYRTKQAYANKSFQQGIEVQR